MNSYEKARDEAALHYVLYDKKALPYGTNKSFCHGSDWANARLQPELEALRAAVRSAYDYFTIISCAQSYRVIREEYPTICIDGGYVREAQKGMKTLKPFLEPGTPIKTYQEGLEAASEHLLSLAERTDAGTTQGIGVALVRAAREILELGKGDL